MAVDEETKARLKRIEAKLDTLLAIRVTPQTICGGCGLPIGPLDGQSPYSSERMLTIGKDWTPRHAACFGR